MYLALQVMSPQAGAMGQNSSMVFTDAGGTIGRVSGNDWVLPDAERFISSRHAIIRYMGGMFSLEDVSINGTFINGEDEAVGARSEPAILKNGDRLQIGDYEIYVSIVEGENDMVAPSPPTAAPMDPMTTSPTGYPPPPTAPPPLTPTSPPADPMGSTLGALDPLEALGNAQAPAPPAAPPSFPDHSSAMSDHFNPPDAGSYTATTSGGAIPDDFLDDVTGFSGGSPSGAIPPTPPLMQGAPPVPPAPHGMMPPPAVAPPQPGTGMPMTDYGSLMPLIVQGMMDVLKSRADIKSQFRMAMTTIKPVENNPLKFSPTAADAMDHLFSNQRSGYLNPVEAFEEGFNDIKAHQLAMIAGMRAAFEYMLEQFSPDVLEEDFEGGGKRGGLMKLAGKARYWEMYREMFDKMTRDSDDNFRRLFGEEFATAYEQQMNKITTRR